MPQKKQTPESLTASLNSNFSKFYIKIYIAAFFLTILMMSLAYHQKMMSLEKMEIEFLEEISYKDYREKKQYLERVLLFLEGGRQLGVVGNGGVGTCDSLIFDCELSNVTGYGGYQLIAAYTKMLEDIPIQSIFIHHSSEVIFLLPPTLQSSSSLATLYQTVSQHLQLNLDQIQNYKIPLNNTQHQYYCIGAQFASSRGVLCVVRQQIILGTIGSNPYFLEYQVGEISGGQYLGRIDFAKMAYDIFPDDEDKPSDIELFNCFKQEIILHQRFIDTDGGGWDQPLLAICPTRFLKNLFQERYLFVIYQTTIDRLPKTTIHLAMIDAGHDEAYYFYSSNQTYHNTKTILFEDYFFMMHLISELSLLFLALTLLALKMTTNNLNNSLHPSLTLLTQAHTLTKTHQLKQYKKLTTNCQPEHFTFIIDYLNKFVHVQQILRCENRTKYKRLLLKCLDMFEGDEYGDVKEFVFGELVGIQEGFRVKLGKIMGMPGKKKQTTKKESEKLLMRKKMSQNKPAKIIIDENQLINNINTTIKNNRGVRFSNEIITVEIGQSLLRRSKFASELPISCKTIKNDLQDLQNETQNKSIFAIKQSQKSLQQQQSMSMISERRRKDSNCFIMNEDSVHYQLNGLKLDQWEGQEEGEEEEDVIQEEKIYKVQKEVLLEEISKSYNRSLSYLESLIQIKKQSISKTNQKLHTTQIQNLYTHLIQKYTIILQSQKHILKNNLQIPQPLTQPDFKDMYYLEDMQNIQKEMMQEGQLVRYKIRISLGLDVKVKGLQELGFSKYQGVRIQARVLLVDYCCRLMGGVQNIAVEECYKNLMFEKTDHKVKKKCLELLISNLSCIPSLKPELNSLTEIKQFYNYQSKKFSFLIHTRSLEPFTPFLSTFFKYIDEHDFISLYDLNDVDEISFKYGGDIMRCRDVEDFLGLFQQMIGDRYARGVQKRQRGVSVKTISKRQQHEKDLYDILEKIEAEQTPFSKWIIVILGEQSITSEDETEQSNSNNNNRTFQQKLHRDLTRIIGQGYFHIILVGQKIETLPSRLGRVKKYIRLCQELVEIQLINGTEEFERLLDNFIS